MGESGGKPGSREHDAQGLIHMARSRCFLTTLNESGCDLEGTH
jgi:hypothetical protein